MIELLVFAADNTHRKGMETTRGERSGEDRNTTKHAATVVSTVRARYAKGSNRAVGQRTTEGKRRSLYLETRMGLARSEPQPQPPRQPVLAMHVLNLHAVLDLECSHEDRAF